MNADAERLVQCLGNLLTNAAKYTPAGGEIRIETQREGDHAKVSVSDNGVGISADLLPKVFDLFVQAERTLDRAQGGLGVGLTIVKRLVEMHDGSIIARSAGLDRGATFEIWLPLVKVGETRRAPPETRQSTPRRILLVDDNPDGVAMLAELLRSDGHHVETDASGAAALDRLNAFRPDVVLLDIGLPGLDGCEVARRIRADPRNEAIQLIAITGYGRDADRVRTREAGFIAHLVKPVEYLKLQQILAAIPVDS